MHQLDSEPRGRRYAKNMIYNRNHLYSRAIHCPTSMEKHYVQWFLLKSMYEITECAKIRFSIPESGRTKPWCPGLASWPSVPYFELLFIGCGFLTHLSNRSDSPRFRAPWNKIRQKYDIQQEPSLFKGHPLSC